MAKQPVNCSWCDATLMRHLFIHSTKRPIKNFFCDTKCKGLWQVRQRENLGFTKEWLFDQYITQGKDANRIAREIGRDGKRVWEWLVFYEIPTRPRGHEFKKHFIMDGSTFRGKKHTDETRAIIKEKAKLRDKAAYANNGRYLAERRGPLHPKWKGGITAERQAFYASVEWQAAVKAVWARDNATCQRCGKHHNTAKSRGTFHIHHIVTFMVRELRAELSNLLLLCKPCHLWVHSIENVNKDYIAEPPEGYELANTKPVYTAFRTGQLSLPGFEDEDADAEALAM